MMTNEVSVKNLRQEILNLCNNYDINNENMLSEMPNSWEKYGDLVLFQSNCFSSPAWNELGDKLWELICSLLKCKRIGLKGSIQNDDFRSPKMLITYGSPGYVAFTDNGIKYTWDPERSMFCRGNLPERHRIAKLDCSNQVIVDLFAGIGYFTLPYLVKAKARFVHACEWNPYAITALRKNLELNGVLDKCKIYEGDNREVSPKNTGHRINVGLIPDSEGFWQTACQALISTGGIIYIHQNITSNVRGKESATCESCSLLNLRLQDLNSSGAFTVSSSPLTLKCLSDLELVWKKVEWMMFSVHISHLLLGHLEDFHKNRWEVTIKEYFKIKSYAPHIDHIVFGAYCYPIN